MRKGMFNIFGIVMLIGILLIAAALVGKAVASNPFLSNFPYIGENISWASDNFQMIMIIGIFLTTLGLFASPIAAVIATIVVSLILMLIGVIPL